jgi:hypothetical protein
MPSLGVSPGPSAYALTSICRRVINHVKKKLLWGLSPMQPHPSSADTTYCIAVYIGEVFNLAIPFLIAKFNVGQYNNLTH